MTRRTWPAELLLLASMAGLTLAVAVVPSPSHAEMPASRRPAASAELLPGDAAPRPEDELWQPMRIPSFGPNPLDISPVVEYQGKLVLVGGFGFEAIGRTRALGAVSWDGTSFERLGTPKLPRFGSALNWNGALVASRGGGLGVHEEVFQWNGTEWDSLATANGGVVAMQLHQGGIVVIGSFTVIGGVAANKAAFFDGSAWHAMGTGISTSFSIGTRVGLESVGGEVYAFMGGSIHRFDGSTWTSTTGNALNGSILGLTTDGVNLYAAGSFTMAGADSCPGVGRWDGSAWHRVGVGVVPGAQVPAITWWNGQLVAWITDGTSRISACDGTYWHGLGDSTAGVFVSGLDACGSRLVARAEHRPPSGVMADVRVYDGVNWIDVVDSWGPDMTGTNFYTNSAASVNGQLYLCGGMRTTANVSGVIRTIGVAAWDGSAWSALGPGLGGQPMNVGQWGSDVIVSGNFFVGSGRNIARWDGTNWSALATGAAGFGSYLWNTAPFRDSLHAASDAPVKGLSGSTWSTVGSSSGTNGPSYALLEWNDRLIATGAFTAADGLPAAGVASWDGNQWAALGSGLVGNGFALCEHAGDLVVGGTITSAGGAPARGAARWDGAAWHAMGSSAVFVTDFAELGGELYAVGVFELGDASRVNSVARWTGTDWQLLGSGIAYTATTLPSDVFQAKLDWVEGFGGDLYCGGATMFAFGQVTSNMMRLPAANTVAVGDRSEEAVSLALTASPNPGQGPVAIRFALPRAGQVRLVIYDVAGREVALLMQGDASAGRHEVRWAASAPPGLYFAHLQTAAGTTRVTRLVRLE